MLVALEPQCAEISDCVFEGRDQEDIGAGDQVQYSGSIHCDADKQNGKNETKLFHGCINKASAVFSITLTS